MRAIAAFLITFVASLALLLWLSEELRVLPRGPGWLLLCFGIAAWSHRLFGKGGKADRLGAAAAGAVAEKVGAFTAPTMAEEPLWAGASREFEGSERREGLYAKAFAAAGGDPGKTKSNYLKARVAELKSGSRI